MGDDPSLAPLKPLLIARTEGNPFFLEESVRTLVETGVLVGEPGAYRLAQALPSIQVPATVQAVLAARIDRLPPEEKRLLQTAAVIGTEVPLPAAPGHCRAARGGAAPRPGASPGGRVPLRDAPVPRAGVHLQARPHPGGGLRAACSRSGGGRCMPGIVEALEALAGERVAEQVERLAHHALRGEVWDKALAYCRQAGEKAMARSAHREAVGSFEQALRPSRICPSSAPRRSRPLTSSSPCARRSGRSGILSGA